MMSRGVLLRLIVRNLVVDAEQAIQYNGGDLGIFPFNVPLHPLAG